jgi:hypothetical protein
MNSRSTGRRLAGVLLLAVLLAAADRSSPAAQPTKKEPDKKEPDKKDPDKKEPDPKKPPEIKWPTDINGKDIAQVMKDVEDPDPTVREFAVRTLPLFGPPCQKKDVAKLMIKRMKVEDDPGVKIAVYDVVGQIQFETAVDNTEVLMLLVAAVGRGPDGSAMRLHAVQAIAMFGSKGSPAITMLTGLPMGDKSYEIRRVIANALGRVGFDETSGPNMKACIALAGPLAGDLSAAVRTEALQSLMLLGPPWAELKKPGAKKDPPIKEKDAAIIVQYLRARIGDPKAKPPKPALEKDKQVEIWCRLVIMRFDPKEVETAEHLDVFAGYIHDPAVGVKIQALQAMGLLGEAASKKLNEVVKLMKEKQWPILVTITAIQVLMSMNDKARPALPDLKAMKEEKEKDLKAAEIELAKKKDDLEWLSKRAVADEMVKLLDNAIKHIEKAEAKNPSPTDPPKKP